MRNFATVVAVSCLLLLTSCAGKKTNDDFFAMMPPDVLSHVNQATFEVIVPREKNQSLVFDHDPLEDVPYQKRHDDSISIGTAFLIGPNRFVSAAHVFQLDTPTLWTNLKLRAQNGKIYTPTLVTRYSNYRDLIEFQVDQPDPTLVPLTLSSNVSAGQTVFAVGDSNGDGITFRAGQTGPGILEPVQGKWKYIRFYSPVTFGGSGGPLVNEKGEVIGVFTLINLQQHYKLAVPISELSKLSTEEAEFYRKDLKFHPLPSVVSREWIFSSSLPKKPSALAAEAYASFSALVQRTYAELLADPKDEYFPRHKGFRSFLRVQTPHADLALLSTDVYGKHWGMREFKEDAEKSLSREQQLKDYQNRGFVPVVVKAEGNLKDFDSDQAKVATTMIQNNSLGVFSELAGKAHFVSVGKPDQVTSWTDRLGRAWRAARWYYHDANVAMSTICTPVPIGEACLVRLERYASAVLEDAYFPLFTNQVSVSYHGSLDQWKHFLSDLDPKLLPQILQGAKVDWVPGKSVTAQLGSISFNLPSSRVDSDSKLFVKVGYDPYKELSSKLLRVEFFPVGDEKEWYGVQNRFAPNELANDEQKSDWKKIKRNFTPYDGQIMPRKEDLYGIFSVIRVATDDLDPSYPGSAVIAICEQPKKDSVAPFEKTCDDFVHSVREKNSATGSSAL